MKANDRGGSNRPSKSAMKLANETDTRQLSPGGRPVTFSSFVTAVFFSFLFMFCSLASLLDDSSIKSAS